MLVKNKKIKTEYGCYGNFVTVTPLEIANNDNGNYIGVTMRFTDGSTEVMYAHKSEIDFDSFK